MAELYSQILGLSKLDVYSETENNDNSYFDITGLPRVLSYGKHPFAITFKDPENLPLLRNSSNVVFEFVDSRGTVIFSNLIDIDDLSGAGNGFIWIKKDPLRTANEIADGPAYFYIAGELGGDGIPNEWKGIYNLRSTFVYDIRKKYPNTSPIIFKTPNNIQINSNFSESIDFDTDDTVFKRSYVNVSASHMETNGGQVRFIELSYKESKSKSNEFKRISTYLVSGSEYEVSASVANGLNPVSHEYKVPTPKDFRRSTPTTFKLRFLNPSSEVAQHYTSSLANQDVEVTSSLLEFEGSPTIVEKEDNLLSGSMFTGNAVGKGFEQSGKSSAYLKTVDYEGFESASIGSGSAGVMFFSGSVLPGSGDAYDGVGLELHGGKGSGSFRFRSNPSLLEIKANTFFVGSENTQFISGSGGNVEISSSAFHLTPEGNVTASNILLGDKDSAQYLQFVNNELVVQGTFTANEIRTPATIGGTASTRANSSSSIDVDGFARFVSASIGGWTVDTGRIFDANDTIELNSETPGLNIKDAGGVERVSVKSGSFLTIGAGSQYIENQSFEDQTINAGRNFRSGSNILSWSFSLDGKVSASLTDRGAFDDRDKAVSGDVTLDVYVPSGEQNYSGQTNTYEISQTITSSFSQGETFSFSSVARFSSSFSGVGKDRALGPQYFRLEYSSSNSDGFKPFLPANNFTASNGYGEYFLGTGQYNSFGASADLPENSSFIKVVMTGSINDDTGFTVEKPLYVGDKGTIPTALKGKKFKKVVVGSTIAEYPETEITWDNFSLRANQRKVELTNEGLLIYNSEDSFIKMDASGIEFRGGSGVSTFGSAINRESFTNDGQVAGTLGAPAIQPYTSDPEDIGITAFDGNVGEFAKGNHRHAISSNIINSVVSGSTLNVASLVASGDVIAKNYIVSSSVTNIEISTLSGSSKFGDTQDDIHQFTGSLTLSSSVMTFDGNGIQIGTAGNNTDQPLRVNNRIMIHQDSGGAGDSELHFDRRHDGADARIKAVAGAGGAYATELHFVTTHASSGEQTVLQLDDNGHIYSDLANAKISGSSTSTGSFGKVFANNTVQIGSIPSSVGTGDSQLILDKAGGGNAQIIFTRSEGTSQDWKIYTDADEGLFIEGVRAEEDLTIKTVPAGGSATEVLKITSTGQISGSSSSTGSFGSGYIDNKLGIGTPNPTSLLHLSASSDYNLILENSGTTSAALLFKNADHNNRSSDIIFQDSGGQHGRLRYNHLGDKFEFIAASVTAVRHTLSETAASWSDSVLKISGSVFSTGSFGSVVAAGTGVNSFTGNARFENKVTVGGNFNNNSGVFNIAPSSGTDPSMYFEQYTSSTDGTLGIIRFGNRAVDGELANIEAANDGATDSAYLAFSTEVTSGALTERLRIHSGGTVEFKGANQKISGSSTSTGSFGVLGVGGDLGGSTILGGPKALVVTGESYFDGDVYIDSDDFLFTAGDANIYTNDVGANLDISARGGELTFGGVYATTKISGSSVSTGSFGRLYVDSHTLINGKLGLNGAPIDSDLNVKSSENNSNVFTLLDDNDNGLFNVRQSADAALVRIYDGGVETITFDADGGAAGGGLISGSLTSTGSFGHLQIDGQSFEPSDIEDDLSWNDGTATTISGSSSSTGSFGQLKLIQDNSPSNPTLNFGDGDSGFYESADDVIRIAIAGGHAYGIDSAAIQGNASNRFAIRLDTPTSTVPNFTPNKADSNTGIGWSSADKLSLIAGGLTGLEITGSHGNPIISGSVSSTGSFGSLVVADAVQGDLTIKGGINYSQLCIKGSGAESGIKFQDSAGNVDGYVYATGDAIGFLDSGAAFSIKHTRNTRTDFLVNNTIVSQITPTMAISGSATSTGSFGQGFIANKLGVGTTSPGVHNASIAGPVLDITGTEPTLALDAGGSGKFALYAYDDYLQIVDDTSTWNPVMTFKGGNVGIGESSPDRLFHIKGATPFIRAESTTAGTDGAAALIEFYATTTLMGQVGFGSGANSDMDIINTVSGGNIDFTTTGAGTFNFTTDGGTGHVTFPVANQKISGSSTSTGSFGAGYIDNKLGIGTTSPAAGLEVRAGSATIPSLGSYGTLLKLVRADGLIGASFDIDSATNNFWLQAQNSSSPAAQALIFNPKGGNVGIGIGSPDRKLHVHNASAGSVTAVSYTELVVEDDGGSGISILAPDANSGNIVMGFPSDNDAVQLRGYYDSGNPRLAIELAASEKFNFIGNQLSGSSTSTGSFGVIRLANYNQAYGSAALNTYFGLLAGSSTTTGNENVAYGRNAGRDLTTASGSVFLGQGAGRDLTTGNQNIAIGLNAMYDGVVTGDNNIAIGAHAGDALTGGYDNIFLGRDVGGAVTTGFLNTFIGAVAGDAHQDGYGNTALGYEALSTSTSVVYATALGAGAMGDGNATTGANYTTAVGLAALKNLTSGGGNVAMGAFAAVDITTGAYNTVIGHEALTNAQTAVSNNTAVGYRAGYKLGDDGGADHSENNVIIGQLAMGGGHDTVANNIANHNVAIGAQALGGATGTGTAITGTNNVAVGIGSMKAFSTGYNNVSIGKDAGDSITTGVFNTLVGTGADLSAAGGENQIVIGYAAAGHGNNIAVIGNTSITAWHPADDDGVALGSASYRFSDVFAVQTTTGGIFETGLKTKSIGENPTGTIVSWKEDGLVPCDKSEDELVMGVIKQGKDEPIVLGAEPVLVTGKVKVGDYIVTSDKIGHGKSVNRGYLLKKNLFGKVIAQALEKSDDSESCLIKCMIRKM